MKLDVPDIPAEERTPLVEALLALIHVQQDRIQQLEATVQQLRDEVALLKGQKPRPDIQPSLLEAPRPKAPTPEGSKRPGSAKRPKTAELHIHQEIIPALLDAGVTQAQLDRIFVDNPRRHFEAAARRFANRN